MVWNNSVMSEWHLSRATAIGCCQFGPIWIFEQKNGAYGLCRIGWGYNGADIYFSWPYVIFSIIWNTSELSELHLSCATAIFVVDCCQFGPNRIFGLKIELIACTDLVGGTTEHSCTFPDLIWYYQWYETLPECLYYTLAVPQPCLLLIAANLAPAGCLGWKWSLWTVQTW